MCAHSWLPRQEKTGKGTAAAAVMNSPVHRFVRKTIAFLIGYKRVTIAGAVARRIVTYASEGEECYIDEHMGFIKFGSRVDVYLPVGSELCVKMGQKTVGNQTVLARLK